MFKDNDECPQVVLSLPSQIPRVIVIILSFINTPNKSHPEAELTSLAFTNGISAFVVCPKDLFLANLIAPTRLSLPVFKFVFAPKRSEIYFFQPYFACFYCQHLPVTHTECEMNSTSLILNSNSKLHLISIKNRQNIENLKLCRFKLRRSQ